MKPLRVSRPLTQDVFKGKAPIIVVACVDFDGTLKFGVEKRIKYTWGSERWRGSEWLEKIDNTDYEPLTSLVREEQTNDTE